MTLRNGKVQNKKFKEHLNFLSKRFEENGSDSLSSSNLKNAKTNTILTI